ASFQTRAELAATPLVWLPTSLSLANYVEAWTSKLTPFSRFFANSLWVSSVTMVATTAISVLAGYALARFRFAGRQTVMLVFLATQMFPAVLLIAPLLSQWHALGLIDTYQALIYSNFSFTVPFTVWMLVGYFESIPIELEESAMIDGCSRFGALCRVVLPLAAPGVAATAIFAFVASWSELLFAITFTSATEMRTVAPGPCPTEAQVPIKIGASLSLTGTYAKPGTYQKEGYDVCAEEVNSKGGLLGRKIEFVLYDDQSTPATGVKLYEKLITE